MGFAGIDTAVYPGDGVMAHLRSKTNLRWCGFYLGPAPSHRGTSWMSKRASLVSGGWGLAPLYVGQQEAGPGSHQVDAAHGRRDGKAACLLAAKAGFPAGAVLYLDIEVGGPLSPAFVAYLQAWCAHVAAGGYTPGAYLSHTSAKSASSAVPGLVLWIFKFRLADVGGTKPAPFREEMEGSAATPAVVAWQWAQNCRIAVPGGSLLVDLDVASVADPSRAAPASRLEAPANRLAVGATSSAWSPPPPPAGDEEVAVIDPRVPPAHPPGTPCPTNPAPPVGWKYWKGAVPKGGTELATRVLRQRAKYPMGSFVQARLGEKVVGARVEWHTVQGATGKKGCFRGVNLMRAAS